jgi:predicted transcriptional regulator
MNQMTTQEQSNLSGSKRKRCGEVEIDYQPVKKLKFEKTERISYGKGLEGSSHCLEVFVFSQLRPKPDGVLLNKLRTLTEKGKLSQKRIAKLIGASQTKISQYMNNSPRVKGWGEFEQKISKLVQRYHIEDSPEPSSSSDSELEFADVESQSPLGSAPLSFSEICSGESEDYSPKYCSYSDEMVSTRDEIDPWQHFSLNQMFC